MCSARCTRGAARSRSRCTGRSATCRSRSATRLVEVLLHEAAPLVVPPEPLPPRQAAVLDGLCRGLSEKQIAAELGMSPHTVHDHVKRLHLRFGVQSRGELIARALRR